MGKHSRKLSRSRKSARARVSERQRGRAGRPANAYRGRGPHKSRTDTVFYAQEDWFEPSESDEIRVLGQQPGAGFVHAVTPHEVAERVEQLAPEFRQPIEVIQLSRMTRKRSLFPCYGMQWGPSVYLYPIEESLVETFVRPPRPEQVIEARMFGGKWTRDGHLWRLTWTEATIRDFYLNNVLIHEIGHVNDTRNTNFAARERYANWFAVEYGYRVSRGRV